MAPHVNANDATPRHRRVEQIQRRLKCGWKDAHRVHAAMQVIEADKKVVDTFILRCLEMGSEKLEKNITYIEGIAAELKAIVPMEPGPLDRDCVWATTGEYNRVASCGAEALLRHAEDLRSDMDDPPNLMYGDPNLIDYFFRVRVIENAVDWEEQERAEEDHSALGSIEMISYHPISRSEADWIETQPLTFRLLLNRVRNANTYSELKELGKAVFDLTWENYNKQAREDGLSSREIKALRALVLGYIEPFNSSDEPNGRLRHAFRINREGQARVMNFWFSYIPPLTKNQRSVFFTYYNLQKSRMNMQPASLATVQPQGQKLLTRINEVKTERALRWLGAQMRNFQSHKISGSRLREPEWRVIWQAYQEKKGEFKQAA